MANEIEGKEETTPQTDEVLAEPSPKEKTQEFNAIYTMVDMQPKPNTLVHWAAHIIMALIILVLCALMFTQTGKLIQQYGIEEGASIASSYQDHDWEAVGFDLQTYAYYYDMYNQYFDIYAEQYQAMGINSMKDLMDDMYQSTVEYYETGDISE